MKNDKRRYPRFEKQLIVVFRYKSIDHFVKAVTENISLGGLCLQLEKNVGLDTDQSLNLQFQLEGTNEIIELEGKIKWISQPGDSDEIQIGIEFAKIDTPEMSQIKDKLQKLLEND